MVTLTTFSAIGILALKYELKLVESLLRLVLVGSRGGLDDRNI